MGSKYASENLVPFYYSFILINISSKSYFCISSSMYIAIIFIAKKNLHIGCGQNSIISKPFNFFWIIISIIKLDWTNQPGLLNSLSKERCFYENKYFDYALRCLRRCLWKHSYRPIVELCSIQKLSFLPLSSCSKFTFVRYYHVMNQFQSNYTFSQFG